MLTLHAFQLMDASSCIPGADVEPVAVLEVPQYVFRVESRMSVVDQLWEAQRTDSSHFKPAALENRKEFFEQV